MAICDAAAHTVQDDGQFPNCSVQNLPVLIYKSAFAASGSPSELANKIEETFDNNGFPPQWRFGLYEYPHYHSTSHEILGVLRGSARVRYNLGSLHCMTCQDPSNDNVQDQLACAMHLAYAMPGKCLHAYAYSG